MFGGWGLVWGFGFGVSSSGSPRLPQPVWLVDSGSMVRQNCDPVCETMRKQVASQKVRGGGIDTRTSKFLPAHLHTKTLARCLDPGQTLNPNPYPLEICSIEAKP